MSKDEKNKEKSKWSKIIKKIFIKIIQLVLIAIIVFCGIKIYKWYQENQKRNDLLDKALEAISITEEGNLDVDFEKLKSQNPECVGYLKVNGLDIEFPVVQHTDNSFYLTHSFDNSYNSAGWIFADYRNKLDGTDKNLIIYGHNRRDGSMFANLKNALTEEWYGVEENRKISFITEQEASIYEVFSIYKIEVEDYYIQTTFVETNYQEFLDTIRKRSVKDFGVNLTEEDNILTLSTCDNSNKYRIVIHAKKIVE